MPTILPELVGTLRFAHPTILLAMTMPTHLRDPAARFARIMPLVSRHKKRGRGECRMRAAPAVSCAKLCEETHTSIQVQRRQSGIPCAMVLRLMARSPRRRIPFATVIDGLMVLPDPVGPAKTSADLAPATGARTTRFRRTPQRRSSDATSLRSRVQGPALRRRSRPTLPRPPHPLPNVRDDHDTPLFGPGRPQL